MNLLEYANKTQSNIILKENFEELLQETFSIIATTMQRSLGPLGSSTTILDGMFTSATKDGYAIMKSLNFSNRYKDMIYNLIKVPCTVLNNTVGDGTTTAIALTNAMYQLISNKSISSQLKQFYRLPREFNSAFETVVSEINEKVQSYATPLESDDYDRIYDLCYVVSNGNAEISKAIADTYKESKFPMIKIKNSPTNDSYIKKVPGFEISSNLIDDVYVRNEDLSTEESGLFTMIFNYKIDLDTLEKLIEPVNDYCKSMGRKLLIIAPAYDAYMADTRLRQLVNSEFQRDGRVNLMCSQYIKVEPHQVDDLAVILRSRVINQDMVKDFINDIDSTDMYDYINNTLLNEDSKYGRIVGECASAILSCTNGSIFKVTDIQSHKRYEEVLRSAKKELQDIIDATDYERKTYAFKISKAQARVSQLEMENYIYYVGADSALEKNILEDAIDDVIKCIRSAIKSGTVPGCQLSIIRACNDIMREMASNIPSDTEEKDILKETLLKIRLLEVISKSVIRVYSLVLRGPDGLGLYDLSKLYNSEILSDDDYKTMSEDEIKERLTTKANEIKEDVDSIEVEIISNSIKDFVVYDLETLKYNNKIITSAETDTRILTAASQLIKILISGNQCLYIDAVDREDDTVE